MCQILFHLQDVLENLFVSSCAKVGHGSETSSFCINIQRAVVVGLGIHVHEGLGAICAKIGPGSNLRSAFSFQCHASPCLETPVLVPVSEHCRRCLTRLCVFERQLMSTTAQQTDDRMSLYSDTYCWLVRLAVLGTFLSSNATRLDAIKYLIIDLIVNF